ncbi:hypothetical protein M8J75_014459 [Diaphorina citri]|nr:hypothetical protein M8J75_014459 [Diaphorina citri]
MSEMTEGTLIASSLTDVDLSKENQSTNNIKEMDQEKIKLKRSFSLTKSALSSTRTRWKSKSKEKTTVIEELSMSDKKKGIFSKPHWKHFINKMVQKVSLLGLHNNKSNNMCSTYDHSMSCRRQAYGLVSLSSNDIRVLPPKPLLFANGDKVPGVIGLRNHGNTCFINAILQCLSHTDILAEYFVLDQYKIDMSRRNKFNSKKYGTKGEVTEQLAVLLKSIWSCSYNPDISNQFKVIIDKYGTQYRGNNQHDAQEFLMWLLDKVHEDLNTATKKKYKTIKNSFGRPDEVVAAETMANHVRCNNSFVHSVFQAQFRSSLTCPRCQRQSNTFDPFLCVSVPVPRNQFQPLYVTILYTSQSPRQVRLGISLPLNSDVRELRETLAQDAGVSEHHMLITEITDLGFQRTFSDTTSISVMRESDPIYCIELPQLKDSSQESTYILLTWVNVLLVEDHCSRFGSPFSMQVGRDTGYADLQKLLLKEMAFILHDDVLTSAQDVPLFRIRVTDLPQGFTEECEDSIGAGGDTCSQAAYLDPTLDHPLFMEVVEAALALCDPGAGPATLKLSLEWDLTAKESTIADDTDQIEEHASVKQLQQNTQQGGTVTLEECFELYTKAEVLGADDAWHCPHCNLKQEVIKKLGLWTLPDILVVHLKRFRQTSSSKQQVVRSPVKITTIVDFPLYGLDMSKYAGAGSNHANTPPWSPWRRNHLDTNLHLYTYDLYAICNHHGQHLQGGHYTAYCRNPYDSQWYSFDDAKVTPLIESELLTPGAYILFYQRRGLSPPSSSSCSSGTGSTSSTTGYDHWANKLIQTSDLSNQRRSSDEISTTIGGGEGENFVRNERGYATLEPVSKRHTNHVSRDSDSYSQHEYALSTTALTSPKSDRILEHMLDRSRRHLSSTEDSLTITSIDRSSGEEDNNHSSRDDELSESQV